MGLCGQTLFSFVWGGVVCDCFIVFAVSCNKLKLCVMGLNIVVILGSDWWNLFDYKSEQVLLHIPPLPYLICLFEWKMGKHPYRVYIHLCICPYLVF